MIYYNFCGGRALRLAIGTLLVFLVFIGDAGALSDANISDNIWDNYSDITSSNGNFPDQSPGRIMHTTRLQNAEQFSNSTGAENMAVQTATEGDVITKVGHFGGLTYAVEATSNYAYIGQGRDFVVLDISNKMASIEVGRVETSSTSMDIVLAGNYAYVANGNSLVIVDVTNPAAPTLKGSYDTGAYSQGVAVEGNYVYVVNLNGLVIVDVTNPAAPTLKGSYNTAYGYFGVEVAGNYAYMTNDLNGLVIVDVTNPATPTLKSSYNLAGASGGVVVEGNFAYVADGGNGLAIVDVSNPAAPTLKGSYDTAGYSFGVVVEGNYAYVADFDNGLVIVNVSNPAAPTLKGSYDTAYNSFGVAVEGNFAYVADYSKGLVIVDVSNPAAPTFVRSYDTAYGSFGVAVAGNYAFVADYSNGLVIVDVTNPAAPTFGASYDTTGLSQGVTVVGNYAYVADYLNGLMIVDVTNPAAPILKGSYNLAGASGGVAVAGNYAYVADSDNGLVIIDVSNPSVPSLKSSFHITGNSSGVAVAGNYAYVTDIENGLVIVDVSNPSVPSLKGSYHTAGNSSGVAVAGNYAYVANGDNGLVIVDVSNPSAPIFKGSYNTAGKAFGVTVEGNYAYVVDLLCLVIVDVSNPAAPTLKGSYDTGGYSFGVTMEGNYAYVAEYTNGLEILRVDPPLKITVGQGAPDLATENHFIDAYNRNGGINILGNPSTEVHRAWGYLVQDFPGASGYAGGIIIYNPYQNYAYYIHSEIWERYYSLGGPNAKTDLNFELGPPTSDIEPYVYKLPPENSKYGTPFIYQKFEGGALEYNIPSGKVFEVHGGILQKWRELGYAASNLGLPTTDEREAAVSLSGLTGRYSVFEGGIIHWIRERNEIFVIGLIQPGGKKIADKYYAEGGSGGWMGFPVSDDYMNPSGHLQVDFEGGYITTTDGTNYVAYPKEISSGPIIKINYPPNDFHTDKQRITLAGIADSDAPIMRIDARITPVNGNPYYYSNIPYGPTSNRWNTNVGLKHGLNIIDVSVADGNFEGSRDSINIYYDEPDFSFVHMTDVHIADLDVRSQIFGLERMNRITKAINQINDMTPKPDFILITGDLVDFSNDFYFNTVKNLFKDITTYFVPGNHDRFDALPLYPDIFPKDIGLYSYNKFIKSTTEFHAKGYEFIGLDSGPDVYDEPCYDVLHHTTSPCSKGLDSLDKLKQLDKITPKIIFMHNPVINKDTDDGSNYGVISQNREELIQYGIDYNVQLVLTGHTHEDRVYNSNEKEVAVSSNDRPLFIQTPSLIFDTNYNHGYRIIEIKDGVATAQPYTSTEYYAGGGKGGGGGGSAMGDFISSNLACPANLHVYDSQGRHTGLNSSGGIETNIPDSFYIGRYNASDPDDAETIFLYNTTEEYRFEIIANLTEQQKNSPENESFNFTIDRQSEGIRTIDSFQNVTLNENTTATLQVNITTEKPNMSLDYNGDRLTDEIKDPNSIETNYAPTAAIISPKIGSIYNESEMVEFNGTGRDPEDGILTNYSLVWYSDIDGTIGSGERFNTANLSAGSHIITLMVNDSMYQYGGSSVTITIADTTPSIRFINGTVMDSVNKTSLSSVTVSTNTNLTTTTNETGFYSFAVTEGEYNLTAKFEPTYYANNTITVSTIGSDVVQDIELLKKPMGTITGKVTGTPEVITVASPNGGEDWKQGTSQIISWTSAGNPGNVNIELLKSGVSNTIISNTANDGSHSWTIPSSQTLGNDYKLRITSAINSLITDTSDNNFIISEAPTSITIASPNGGENWRHGTTHTITWLTAGSPGSNVKIELLRSGTSVKTISSSTANDGSYNWAISSTQTVANDYKIGITSTSNSSYKDTSDNNFIIST